MAAGMKLMIFGLAVIAVLVESVAAADAPAPSPTSGASIAAPGAAIASLTALAAGFLFC